MSFPDRPTIRITSTADLLALIPFMLGFQPDASSLVLVAIDDGGVPFTARLTLPTSNEASAALHAGLNLVTAKLKPRDGLSVLLVGYGPADHVQEAVTAATATLRQAGIPISDVLRVADGRFWRLSGSTPDDGTAFEPTANPAAAAAVYAGLVALPDRDALVDTLAPVTGPARERMIAATAMAGELLVELLDAALTNTDSGESRADPLQTPLGLALQHAARTYLTQAHDSYRDGQPIDDEHAAALTVLLDLPPLRDFAARRTSGDSWQIQMWTDLVRRAEPPFTAGPAILLALSALQAGHGTLASIAIERALAADPDNRLARLLARAIAAGIDPATAAALLAE